MMHNPEVIGREFAKQYYFILDRSPENLFRFYMESAQFDHDAIDSSVDEPISAAGRDGIRDAVEARSSKHNFQFTVLRSVQSLATLADSVMVLVMGEISFDNAPMRPFSQTFMLVPETPFRYFVANDIFRYTDYVIDEDFDELTDSDQLSGSSFMNDGVDEHAEPADRASSRDMQSLSLKGIMVKESQPLTRKSLLKSASAAPPPATEKLTWSEEMEACDEQAKHHDQMFQDQCILTIGNRINPNIRFDDAKESACADTSSTIDQTEVALTEDFSPCMAGGSDSAGQYSADDYAEYSKMEPFDGDNYCGYGDSQPEVMALQMHHMTMGPILVYPMAPMQAYMHPSMISDPKQDEYLMQLVPAHPILPERIEAARTTSGEPMPARTGGSKKSKAEIAMQSTEDDVMNVQLLPKRRSSKSRRTLDKATGIDAPTGASNKAAAGTQVDLDAVPVAAVKSAGIQCGSPLMSAKTTVATTMTAEQPEVTAAPRPPSPKAAESSKVDQKPADRRLSSSTSSAASKKQAAATAAKSPAAAIQSFAPPAPAPSAATTAPTPTTYADLVKNPTSPRNASDLPEIEAPAERRYSASFSRAEKPRLQRGMSFHGDRDKFQRSKRVCR